MIVHLAIATALALALDDCPKASAGTPAPPAISTYRALIQAPAAAIEIKIDEKAAEKVAEKAIRLRQRALRASAHSRAEGQTPSPETAEEIEREIQKHMDKVGSTHQYLQNPAFAQGFLQSFKFDFAANEPKVALDIDNLPLQDALKKLFKATRFDYSVEDGIAKDVRVTIKVPSIQFSTALDMLTQAAHVNWTSEMRISPSEPMKIHYRIVKSAPSGQSMFFVQGSQLGRPKMLQIGPKALPNGSKELLLTSVISEQRSKITCPHCKGKVVAYRPKTVTKCVTCRTPYPAGKLVCAKDGTRRPTPAPTWKFCPLCGKSVDFKD